MSPHAARAESRAWATRWQQARAAAFRSRGDGSVRYVTAVWRTKAIGGQAALHPGGSWEPDPTPRHLLVGGQFSCNALQTNGQVGPPMRDPNGNHPQPQRVSGAHKTNAATMKAFACGSCFVILQTTQLANFRRFHKFQISP